MKRLSYNEYFDKVYGCFLGKCIGGTAGGPAEGRKELLDAPLNEELLHLALPNDDLDLQILWLELLEDRGADITERDMAEYFFEKVPYGYGEYGYFAKNYACGIYPPTSGVFNNSYYKDGMGCPIRSEIWGCLFPGAPELTERYVRMDGCLDHESDSIDAEYFLAALEAEAFFSSGYEEIIPLIRSALSKIKPDTKIHKALSDAVDFYLSGKDWKWARGEILRRYGHSDCTNLYQNMAFTVLTLLYCKGDFRETVRLGLAMGYDTDCVCATVASILGIMRGAKALLTEDGMTDTGLNIGVRTRRQGGSIEEFSRDVCAVGLSFAKKFSGATEIYDHPEYTPIPDSVIPEFTVRAEYKGDPVLIPDRVSTVILHIKRNHGEGELPLSFSHNKDIRLVCPLSCVKLSAGESLTVTVEISLDSSAGVLKKSNIIEVKIGDFTDTFGLMGGVKWYRYGPFLMNNQDISATVAPHIVYGPYITADADNTAYDALRDYHLNSFADIDREFLPEGIPFLSVSPDGSAERDAEIIYTGEDLFDLADIQSYKGPHTDYLMTTLICPEDRDIELALGHTAPFKLWINGELVGESRRTGWWTCENRHFDVRLRRGENTLILKCAQQSHTARYSVMPRRVNSFWLQWCDIDCKL